MSQTWLFSGNRFRTDTRRQRGVTLIEILITIVILVFGLLGLAGLQARIQIAELESYQRGQAVLLLQDMVDRLTANRRESSNYVTSTTGVGTSGTATCNAGDPLYTRDLCEWGNALAGAAETRTSGITTQVGAMIGARGCVFETASTMPREYLVTVAWQGLSNTASPAGMTCGQNQYGNEAARRAITARVVVGCLQNTATGTCVTP